MIIALSAEAALDPRERAWWVKKTPRAQRAYLEKHPNSVMARHHKTMIGKVVAKATNKVLRTIDKNMVPYEDGLKGLKSLSSGAKLSKSQRAGVVKIGKVVAMALLVGLGAMMLFTPVGGAVQDIATKFVAEYLDRGPRAPSESSSKDSSDKEVSAFVAAMSYWLQTKDLSQYGEKNANV